MNALTLMYSAETTHNSTDVSLQVCHCGWSSVTSYHGLRIHQGKMGCTPMGLRIPESEQHLWGNWWHGDERKDARLEISAILRTEVSSSHES